MPLPSFVPLSRENSDISAIGLLFPYYLLSYSPSFSSHFPSLVMFVGDQAAVLELLWCDITDGRIPQPWREMKTKKPKGNEESKASKVTRPKAQDVKFSSIPLKSNPLPLLKNQPSIYFSTTTSATRAEKEMWLWLLICLLSSTTTSKDDQSNSPAAAPWIGNFCDTINKGDQHHQHHHHQSHE